MASIKVSSIKAAIDELLNSATSQDLLPKFLGQTIVSSVANERFPLSCSDLILHYRHWYGDRFARMSVMYLNSYFLDIPDLVPYEVAKACWEVHRNSCNDQAECALHALGPLWINNRFPSAYFAMENRDFAFKCLSDLIAYHPLRSWSQRALFRSATSIEKNEFPPWQILSLLSSMVESFPSAVFFNSDLSTKSWRIIMESCENDLKPRALKLGNILISRGLTSIIDPQLVEYPAGEFEFAD